MILRVKPGVSLKEIKPQVLLGLLMFHSVAAKLFPGKELTVTSVSDSQHGPNSLHPKGYAVDIRSKNFSTEEKYKLLREATAALGAEFDLILESEGKPYEHFHLEWDPKSTKASKLLGFRKQ